MQTLFLHSQEADPFVLLRVVGEIDLHNQDEFEQVLGELLEASPVVVDLSELDFFAISALRSLILSQQRAVSTGHAVSYADPSKQLLRIVGISGLGDVLPIHAPHPETVAVA